MTNGENQNPVTSSIFHLLAGTSSGFTSAILLQPFDLLKTRVQQQSQHGAGNVGPSKELSAELSRRSTPIIQALKEIWAQPQPVRQLWRGTLPSVIRTSVGSGLYFATLDKMRRMIAQSKAASAQNPRDGTASTTAAQRTSALPQLGLTANLVTGAVARASAGFIMMPVTVLKVRFESNIYTKASDASLVDLVAGKTNNPYGSLFTATREVARTEGIRGFFKGAGATAIRDAPYAGIYVGLYEASKSVLSPVATQPDISGNVSGSSSMAVNFTSGALAATLATTITNPPDVVKTRLQLMPEKYTNAFQTLKLMLREEGLASLWDGLGLRVSRKALSSALAWTVYEEVVRRATSLWKVS